MAGIGFVLKRMVSHDDLFGILRAYIHSAFAASGPWLFTVIALGGTTVFYSDYFSNSKLVDFRVVIIYNFSISLVCSAPVYMVVTRYLADNIHRLNVTYTPSVLLTSMGWVYAIQLVPALWFYLIYTNLELSMRISAIANAFLIASIWLLGTFLLGLKDYQAVTRSFAIGMLLAFIFSQALKPKYGAVGMVNGSSIGLAYIFFSMTSKIFAEYPYRLRKTVNLRQYYEKYWHLAVAGVFYNAGIWVDKWIMWYAPESVVLPSKMRYYPDYDSAMFMAYLTIVPAMAMFVFSVETNFFQRYQKFYYDILEHKSLRKIRENHQLLLESIFSGARNFIVIHGTTCFLAIVLAAEIFALLNISYLQIGIFRLGCLGAFFHALLLFEQVIMAYLDCRRSMMVLQAIFFFCNAFFTLISMWMGFPFYGYGYFLASLVCFLITTHVLFNHLRILPYHAFITNNNSVRYEKNPITHPPEMYANNEKDNYGNIRHKAASVRSLPEEEQEKIKRIREEKTLRVADDARKPRQVDTE